jgi:hypothetical protein
MLPMKTELQLWSLQAMTVFERFSLVEGIIFAASHPNSWKLQPISWKFLLVPALWRIARRAPDFSENLFWLCNTSFLHGTLIVQARFSTAYLLAGILMRRHLVQVPNLA